MFLKSTLLHLRIPFSFFLMPVYLFALAVSPNFDESQILWTFVIIHLFLYPASNGYNSYFDKDEKSIGGLKNPPPVNKGLYSAALLFDAIALVLSYLKVNLLFTTMILVYGLVSKAYSHPAIRLKKFAIGGWLVTGLFQGCFTFLMCYVGINDYGIDSLLKAKVLIPGILTSIMLWGNYPMTQVYQHEEDAKHGDFTLSRMLGIRGTFIFVQTVFGCAAIGFVFFFKTYYELRFGYAFLIALAPVVLYFMYWFAKVLKDETEADFKHTMLLNLVSAVCLSSFFIYFFLENTHLYNF